MAFDAAMTAAVADELSRLLTGARTEKVQQPEKDEIVLLLRAGGRESYRLSISAGAANPKIGITGVVKENPAAPPMFCMLLRKHLTGSKITGVRQLGFERAIELTFEARDELGFECEKTLVAEIMGKYSNIIFCDKDKKILGAAKIIDFSTSQKRQVLPGMTYELPPPQDKKDPLGETREGFLAELDRCADGATEKFITGAYLGLSQLTAREILFRAGANRVPECERLADEFIAVMDIIKEKRFTPTLLVSPDGKPLEYSFMPIAQYGASAESRTPATFGALFDEYFGTRDKLDRIKQRSSDILHLLTSAETKLNKKTALQRADLKACADKDKLRRAGDLITSNMHRVERGAKKVSLTDYYSETLEEVEVELDPRLSPSQNAQKYYKKYNKAKTAETMLTRQLELSAAELDYLATVFDALAKAETESDLNEIRRELYETGYASKRRALDLPQQKRPASRPLELVTDGGYRLLCGKNNLQNEFVTFKAASKRDWWFHVKGQPGSHVVLLCDGAEPPELDFTQAATVAAVYSSASDGVNVPVDYTLVKNVKKPPSSKPGYVTYSTNWTAFVTPDPDLVSRLVKK